MPILLAFVVVAISMALTSGTFSQLVTTYQGFFHTKSYLTGNWNKMKARAAVRSELLALMRFNGLTSQDLLLGLRCAQDSNECPSPLPASWNGSSPPQWAQYLTAWHPLQHSGAEGRATDVSQHPVYYLEYEIRTSNSTANLSHTRIKVRLGESSVFLNAMTGSDFRCTTCHAQVYGNVAQYKPLTAEVKGMRIYGKFLSAGPLDLHPTYSIMETTDPAMLHHTTAYADDSTDTHPDLLGRETAGPLSAATYNNPNESRVFQVETESPGIELPYNTVRQKRMLPKFDPNSMLFLASGEVSGGLIQTVPLGSSASPSAVGQVSGIVDGNLILNGRGSALNIEGRLFVRGDVIVFGEISGQGEIYSGGTIYIPDDIVYSNPPPHFDGSSASNSKMSQVSTNGPALAQEMAGYDRLGLFAANNIVIGSPYPEGDGSGMIQGDIRYMLSTILRQYSGLVGRDKEFGYMMDSEALSPTQKCFLFPWDSMDNCIPQSASDFTTRVHVPLGYRHPDINSVNNREYYLSSGAFYVPDLYSDLFLPKNMVAGVLVDWINRTNFINQTKNDAEWKYASSQPEGNELRQRFKDFVLPLPGSNPYDLTTISTQQVLDTIENLTGLFSETSGLMVNSPLATTPMPSPPPPQPGAALAPHTGCAAGSPKTLRCEVADMINLCRRAFQGDGTTDRPVTGVSGRDRFTWKAKDAARVTLMHQGAPYQKDIDGDAVPDGPFLITGMTCHLSYAHNSQRPTTFIDYMSSYDDPSGGWGPAARGKHCDDLSPLIGGFDSTAGGPAYAAGNGPGFCHHFPYPVDSTSGQPTPATEGEHNDRRLAADDDLLVEMHLYHQPYIKVATRYWNPSITAPQNQIKKVQAYLFANHFILLAQDSLSDRQLRIHGGLTAKDFVGRNINKLGSDRNYTMGRRMSTTMYHTSEQGILPALIVIQDPRFQYSTVLPQADFGRVEYVE